MKISQIDFLRHLKTALIEKWKDIIPADWIDVKMSIAYFDPEIPHGIVFVRQPDSTVLQLPFSVAESSSELVELTACMIDNELMKYEA
jgi:hypothetical protein